MFRFAQDTQNKHSAVSPRKRIFTLPGLCMRLSCRPGAAINPRKCAFMLPGLLILIMMGSPFVTVAASVSGMAIAVEASLADDPAASPTDALAANQVNDQATGDTRTQAETDEVKQPAARLAAGYLHSALIHYDSQLYVWGDNSYGQLGLSGPDQINVPTLLTLPAAVSAVSLGMWHTLILTADGRVYACGRNSYGQLGNGRIQNSSVPVLVEGLPAVQAVAAGAYHSLALGADGSVWAWGSHSQGQASSATAEVIKDESGTLLGSRCTEPVQILASGAVAIAAGGHFSLYLTADGQVFAWGDNSKGQLGQGNSQPAGTGTATGPVPVSGLSQVVTIAAGYEHALAIVEKDGLRQLYAWGDHSLGQLGLGSQAGQPPVRTTPERVDLTGDDQPENDDLVTVTAGYMQSAAIANVSPETGRQTVTDRQRLYVWGSDSSGQLGIGKPGSQNLPHPVSGTYDSYEGSDFLPFDAIACGGEHLLVLSSKGLLAAAGRGDRGQLGTLTNTDQYVLTGVEIPDLFRPAWAPGQSIRMQWRANQTELKLGWPAAQDNRLVAGYRLAVRKAGQAAIYLDAGHHLSYTLTGVDPQQPLEIKVYAYDQADTADKTTSAGLAGLGFLTAHQLPSGQDPAAYFLPVQPVTAPEDPVIHRWQPDPAGQRRPLEVPWSQIYISGIQPIPRLKPWIWLAPAAGVLILAAAVWYLGRKRTG